MDELMRGLAPGRGSTGDDHIGALPSFIPGFDIPEGAEGAATDHGGTDFLVVEREEIDKTDTYGRSPRTAEFHGGASLRPQLAQDSPPSSPKAHAEETLASPLLHERSPGSQGNAQSSNLSKDCSPVPFLSADANRHSSVQSNAYAPLFRDSLLLGRDGVVSGSATTPSWLQGAPTLTTLRPPALVSTLTEPPKSFFTAEEVKNIQAHAARWLNLPFSNALKQAKLKLQEAYERRKAQIFPSAVPFTASGAAGSRDVFQSHAPLDRFGYSQGQDTLEPRLRDALEAVSRAKTESCRVEMEKLVAEKEAEVSSARVKSRELVYRRESQRIQRELSDAEQEYQALLEKYYSDQQYEAEDTGMDATENMLDDLNQDPRRRPLNSGQFVWETDPTGLPRIYDSTREARTLRRLQQKPLLNFTAADLTFLRRLYRELNERRTTLLRDSGIQTMAVADGSTGDSLLGPADAITSQLQQQYLAILAEQQEEAKLLRSRVQSLQALYNQARENLSKQKARREKQRQPATTSTLYGGTSSEDSTFLGRYSTSTLPAEKPVPTRSFDPYEHLL